MASIYFHSGVLGMAGDKQKRKKKIITAAVIGICVCCAAAGLFQNKPLRKEKNEAAVILGKKLGRQVEKGYFMLPDFLENGETADSLAEITQQALLREIPIYYFAGINNRQNETEDDTMAELIRQEEGEDEEKKNINEDLLDYGEDALHIENSILQEMEEENNRFQEENEKTGEEQENRKEETEQSLPGEMADAGSFQRADYPAYTYDWSENWEYEDFISNFYAVDNSTALKEDYISLNNLLYKDLSIDKTEEGPQILIYHTHSQEDFADSVPGDASTTIVGAGEKLARLLEEEYGFQVLHHTGEYDVESRQDAYSDSLPAIEKILSENPTIEVVIDVHRDEMREGKKLVMDLQGRPTARFMFFNGLSYIRNKGDIGYLENPYIQENLAFSFQAQVAANEYYPGLARKVYLKAYRYNMHLKPKSMLIELGAQTNTVEEIMNACDPIAHILAIVLDEML